MHLAQKLQYLRPPPALPDGWRTQFDYGLIQYIGLRRSRFGIKPIVKWLLRNRQYCLRLDDVGAMAGRYADYGDFVAIRECLVDKIYDFDRLKREPSLIVDAGAHIGSFCLAAARRFPATPLIAFEPDRFNWQLLQENVAGNNVKAALHNVALSNFTGSGSFGGVSGIGARLGAGNGECVAVRRLSELVDVRPDEALLIKIDVEGEEFKILDDFAGRLPQSTFMFVEVHEGESAVFRLRHVLEPLGFRVELNRASPPKGLAIDCCAVRGGFV